jgi:hypothetical protein
LEHAEKYDGYPDGILESFNLPIQFVELTSHLLQVGPCRPSKASQEEGEEDRGYYVLRRSTNPLEKRSFNASGR